MGNLYNNVGATGLIAQSNHYCPVIMGDNIICWRLDGDKPGVCGMYIGGTNNRYWTGRYWTIHCWTTVIGSGVIGPSVVGPGDQTGRPYIRVVDVLELRFDKMSNEGVYNALPRTKIRFGGFGGPSRAIRKIQIDADRGVGTTFRRVLGTDGCPFSVFGS